MMKFLRVFWNWFKRKVKIRSINSLLASIRLKYGKFVYKRKFDSIEFIEHLKIIGLKPGSVVLIHSSWNEFYNYKGSINEFLNSLIEYIGPDGTILMPAYPFLRRSDSVIDILNSPTVAGLIAEEFRRYPGVKRSVNMHSVCALGPLSDFLINDHSLSITSWDNHSPYYKLSLVNGFVLTLGVGRYLVGTIMHCVDSVLREESDYFRQFFTKKVIHKFRLEDRSFFEKESLVGDDNFRYYFNFISHNFFVRKYFDSSKYKRTKLSNLNINVYDATYVINRMIELGKAGKTVYLLPRNNRK